MKKFTKIGRVSGLYMRTIKLNEAVAVSFEVGGQRFSATFSPGNFDLETGDLVKIEYEKEGFLNKIIRFEIIASGDVKVHIAFFIFWLILSAFFVCGIVMGMANGKINFSGFDGLLGLLFPLPATIFTLKAMADRFKILRLLRESERRLEK